MDIGSVFLVLALAVLVVLFIGQPFLRSRQKKMPAEPAQISELEHKRSVLLAERDRLLLALQELDFDYGLAKIPEEDYPIQRANLVQQAAAVLKGLDEIEGQQGQHSAEARIEQAVAARRADGMVKSRSTSPQPAVQASRGVAAAVEVDALEELIANRRVQRKEKSGGFCPKCGRPVTRSDKFCSSCGNLLS